MPAISVTSHEECRWSLFPVRVLLVGISSSEDILRSHWFHHSLKPVQNKLNTEPIISSLAYDIIDTHRQQNKQYSVIRYSKAKRRPSSNPCIVVCIFYPSGVVRCVCVHRLSRHTNKTHTQTFNKRNEADWFAHLFDRRNWPQIIVNINKQSAAYSWNGLNTFISTMHYSAIFNECVAFSGWTS